MQLLEKGVKHSLKPLHKTKTINSLIIDLETKISLNDTLVNDCATFLKELQVDSIDPGTHKIVWSISEKIKSNQLVIAKADKDQSIVIQNKIDYNKKVDQYLSSSGATNDSSYDFKGYVASVRKAINASDHALKIETK